MAEYPNTNWNLPYPFLGSTGDDTNLKQPHDRYDVYVNGDLVGHKVLLNETDNVDDVAKFLKSRGITDFDTNLDGDHYNVSVNDDGLLPDVRNNLKVYLDIR